MGLVCSTETKGGTTRGSRAAKRQKKAARRGTTTVGAAAGTSDAAQNNVASLHASVPTTPQHAAHAGRDEGHSARVGVTSSGQGSPGRPRSDSRNTTAKVVQQGGKRNKQSSDWTTVVPPSEQATSSRVRHTSLHQLAGVRSATNPLLARSNSLSQLTASARGPHHPSTTFEAVASRRSTRTFDSDEMDHCPHVPPSPSAGSSTHLQVPSRVSTMQSDRDELEDTLEPTDAPL